MPTTKAQRQPFTPKTRTRKPLTQSASKALAKATGKQAAKVPVKEVMAKVAVKPPIKPLRSNSARIQVRKSGVHGKGVFAKVALSKGERLIEYLGEIISWPQAQKRHPHNPKDPNHTFFFHVDDKRVIDAAVGGNAARWINHACNPNCKAEEEDGRIFIEAKREIAAGEELFYDYGLIIEERYTPALKQEYECRCGAPRCRRTMLAPKR